jgi:transcriptional regulator with XRE-family HTH domain
MSDQKIGKIRLERLKADMTQVELARKIGVSANYIHLVERGKRNPSFKTLRKMSRVLKVPASQLLENEQALQEIKKLNKKYHLEQIIEGLLKIVKKRPPKFR